MQLLNILGFEEIKSNKDIQMDSSKIHIDDIIVDFNFKTYL